MFTEESNDIVQYQFKESLDYIVEFAKYQKFLFLDQPTFLGFHDFGKYLLPVEKMSLRRSIKNLLNVFEGEILDFSRDEIKAKVTYIWTTTFVDRNELYPGQKITIFYERSSIEIVKIIFSSWKGR